MYFKILYVNIDVNMILLIKDKLHVSDNAMDFVYCIFVCRWCIMRYGNLHGLENASYISKSVC